MKPDPFKLRQRTHEHLEQTPLHTQRGETAHEFASAEKVIQYDSDHTPVPPQIAVRLNESIAREPKPAVSWWRRLFTGAK